MISASFSDNVSNQNSEQELTASKESQEKTKVGDSSRKGKRYSTRLTSRMPAPANTVSVDQIVENESPETSSCGKETVIYNQKQDSVKSCKRYTDVFILREALREVLGDDYKEKLGMLQAENRNRVTMFQMLTHDAQEQYKMFEELIKTLDDGTDSQEVTPNKQTKIISSGIQNNDDNMDTTEDDINIESKNNNTSDKIRGKARKFILPPEYDPEDSKWTLKHREYKKGLVELTPNSHIYVNAMKLSKCKRNSKDSKILARMLLLEVFSMSALSICSLTGKKANAFDLTGTRVRPGLDEHARNVLLNFVEQHAVDQKWVYWDRATISNSLRNKMQELRAKHG